MIQNIDDILPIMKEEVAKKKKKTKRGKLKAKNPKTKPYI
jgi:hypothetical protein